MKHIVEIKYTNPSHEHVSLRRRVETVNRVVEAQSADEALNRAANQQRSLGFRIQSANIVEQVLAEEVEQLDEGKLGKALAVGAMSLASMGAKAHTDTTKSVADLARERPAVSTLLSKIGAQGQVPASDKRAAELQKKQDQEMPASERRATELSKMKKEEVEQVDEVNRNKTKTDDYGGRYLDSINRDKEIKELERKISKMSPNDGGGRYLAGLKLDKMKAMKEEAKQVDEAAKGPLHVVHVSFTNLAAVGPHRSTMNYKVHAPDKEAAKRYAERDLKHKSRSNLKAHSARLVKEEVEQVDEANMRFDPEAAARPKSSDVKNFLNRNKNARAGAASKKYIRRMTKLGGLGPNQNKKDTEAHMKANFGEEFGADKRDAGYKMSPAVRKAQGESDRLSKVVKPVQAGTLAAQRRRAEMKKEEVETVDEGNMSGLKKAQVKWRTAHRAVYGTDPSAKSMVVGAIAKLAGAKASTARAVGSAVGGKPVSKQQQAAAIKRAGKPAMARMRNEEKDTAGENDVNSNVKGKLAADKMTKKAAEIRKAKIEGGVNEINLEPMIDLHRPASLDPNKRIQK